MLKTLALRALSIGVAIAGYSMLPFASASESDVAQRLDAAATADAKSVAVGDSVVLDVTSLLGQLRLLRPDERRDQLADWAMYGAVLQSPLSGGSIRGAMYDRLPVRSSGFEQATSYDYGAGRRVILDGGTAWLFYSAADSQHVGTIAHLADQVRMELGSIPKQVSIFRFRADVPDGQIVVTHEQDLPGDRLFGAEYGYVERLVRNEKDIAAMLDTVDDIVHARVADGGVQLGGRRITSARTAGATLDDVAALYQAHTAIERGEAGRIAEPGFSLDPSWDVAAVTKDIRVLLDDPMRLVAAARAAAPGRVDEFSTVPVLVRDAALVEDAFRRESRVPMRDEWRSLLEEAVSSVAGKSAHEADEGALVAIAKLKDQLANDSSYDAMLMQALVQFITARNRFQCARYDGPLQGTHAGMVLYYTDLVAKTWRGVNYAGSAPVNEVRGFLTRQEAGGDLEPVYWHEARQLPNTRLWFGPRTDGYASRDDGAELNFSHVSTRVYSAGSNPLNPGKEQAASEDARRAIDWWDHHFAEVADYEPLYHQQNQIMKWSVLTGWLRKHSTLDGLSNVTVSHDLRFDRWYAATDTLRFHYSLPFVPRQRWPEGTECIEILRSSPFPSMRGEHTIEGGVSLGGARSIESGTKIGGELSLGIRRAGLDYEASSATRIVNLRKTVFELPPVRGRVADVFITPPDNTLRLGGTQVHAERLEARIAAESRATSIDVAVQGKSFGHLAAERGGGNVHLRWNDGPIATDRDLLRWVSFQQDLAASARRMSAEERLFYGVGTNDPATAIAGHTDYAPTSHSFVVQSADGADVLVAAPNQAPRGLHVQASADPNAYVTTSSRGEIQTTGREITAADVAAKVDASPWQRLSPKSGLRESDPEAVRVFTSQGPGSGGRNIKIETGRADLPVIDAVAQDDHLFLQRPGDARMNRAFDDIAVSDLSSKRVQQIIDLADRGDTRATLAAIPGAEKRSTAIGRQIARGDVDGAIDALDRAAREGKLADAVQDLRAEAADAGLVQYAAGRRSGAAQLFARSDVAANPKEAVFRALREIDEFHDVQRAADALDAALKSGNLSEDAGDALAGAFRRTGNGDIEDVVRAANRGLATPDLHIERAGRRLHSVADVRPDAFRVLSRQERLEAIRLVETKNASLYLEDGLLGKVDFDPDFGGSVARLALDPGFRWERVALADHVGQPSKLAEGASRSTRVTDRLSKSAQYSYRVSRCPNGTTPDGNCRAA